MPTITKSIGTVGRDYSTIAAWEADLDNTTPYDAGDDAVGECYNDSAFNESVTFNGGGTLGLNSARLSVASGQRHDGTAGTGARISRTASASTIISISTTGVPRTVEWLELNGNDNDITEGFNVNNTTTPHVGRYLLVHNLQRSSVVYGIRAQDPAHILNTIVYGIVSTNTGSLQAAGIADEGGAADDFRALNCTVHGVTRNNGTGAGSGIKAAANNAAKVIKNCIAVATAGTTSGTKADFVYGGNNVDDSNNLSSDATADDAGGSGHLINQVTADQFVSTTGGSEDFHLKTGADAIDAGVDLATTPTGVNIDIDGRDRDAQADTWDIGADEFVAAGGGAITGTLGQTLGALTASASGAVKVQGSASATLGVLTLSSAAVAPISGQTSVTLGALTATATGVTPIKGNTDVTLGELTANATAVAPIEGQTTATLGEITLVATGVVPIVGQAAITLGAVTTTATGTVPIVGQAAITLGAINIVSAGVIPIKGSLGITLGELTCAGTGVIGNIITGTLNETLGAVTVSASGKVIVRGSATVTLGQLIASATGVTPVEGATNGVLGTLTLASSGVVLVRGSLGVSLSALTLIGQGIVGEFELEGDKYEFTLNIKREESFNSLIHQQEAFVAQVLRTLEWDSER